MASTFQVPANNAASTLSASIVGGDLSCTLVASTSFPTTYPFPITIDSEIIKVTNNNTGTGVLTIVRAQEGTSAASHSSGAVVALKVTAKFVSDLNTAVNAIENAKAAASGLASLNASTKVVEQPASISDFIETTPTNVATKVPSSSYVFDMSRKNAIINGCMRVPQRGTSFTSATTPANSDDTYLLDRWILLSDGNDIVDVTQVTTPVPTGSYAAACFDIETEDKKWGIIQILEAKDSARFIGGTVSISFKARMGAADTSTLLRAAVLSWSSTADTVTSDVVNAWGAEGTNPTVVANWTLENTPAALDALTASYQTYKIEGILIDTASTTNIAVFIWSDDMTNAVGDLVYITGIQLELGSVATPFEFRPYGQELALCQRYYFRIGGDAAYTMMATGQGINTTQAVMVVPFPTTMRALPSVVAYSTIRVTNNAAGWAITNVAFDTNYNCRWMGVVDVTIGSPNLAALLLFQMTANNSTSGYIDFGAEL